MHDVIIYTDGSCLGNGEPNAVGGFAAIALCGKSRKPTSGGILDTTNNRAEMTSVIEGLNLLKEPCNVIIISDSKYVVDGYNKNRGRSKNLDLWAKLDAHVETHNITWTWCKGHNNNKWNESVNTMAQTEAARVAAGQARNVATYGCLQQDESEQMGLEL